MLRINHNCIVFNHEFIISTGFLLQLASFFCVRLIFHVLAIPLLLISIKWHGNRYTCLRIIPQATQPHADVTSAMRAHAPRTLFPSRRIRGETPYYRNAPARLRHLWWFINVRASGCENNEWNNVPRYANFSLRTSVRGKWQLFSTN